MGWDDDEPCLYRFLRRYGVEAMNERRRCMHETLFLRGIFVVILSMFCRILCKSVFLLIREMLWWQFKT